MTLQLLVFDQHVLPPGLMDGCVPKSAISNQEPTNRQSGLEFHTIIQSLSRQWPSLPALLLHGAVQRLCKLTQPQPHTDAPTLAGWVKLLLEPSSTAKGQVPLQKGQQASPSGTRAGKRKSLSSDPRTALSAEASGYSPTGLQLRACIGVCLAAMPACSDHNAGAVRQVLSQLLQHLQRDHPCEYANWGHTAQTLAASCFAQEGVEHLPALRAAFQWKPSSDEPSSDELCSAQQRQQSLLGDLHTSADGSKRSVIHPPEPGCAGDQWLPCWHNLKWKVFWEALLYVHGVQGSLWMGTCFSFSHCSRPPPNPQCESVAMLGQVIACYWSF